MTAWASAAMARGVLLSDRHVPASRAPLWRSRELVFSILVSPAVAVLPCGRAVGDVLVVGELGAVEGDEAVAAVFGGGPVPSDGCSPAGGR